MSMDGSHWRVLIMEATDQFTYFKDPFGGNCEAKRLEMKAGVRAERPVRRRLWPSRKETTEAVLGHGQSLRRRWEGSPQ